MALAQKVSFKAGRAACKAQGRCELVAGRRDGVVSFLPSHVVGERPPIGAHSLLRPPPQSGLARGTTVRREYIMGPNCTVWPGRVANGLACSRLRR